MRHTCYRLVGTEGAVSENWREERDRLIGLIQSIESGETTHLDDSTKRELQAATPDSLALLKERLATLNSRLGDDRDYGSGNS